ncbi:MAG TPA: hypothetical protein VNQ79_04945 [Blastocatellia bacterium]|nr:hypothetical protein [Blastocatellia bacterium]
MNCREFEQSIVELSDGGLMDAAQRSLAQAHAEACAHCAERLAAERRTVAALRALAARDSAVSAPAHLRHALEAAFDENCAALNQAPVTARQWLRRGLAAAAAILLLFALAVSIWQRMNEQEIKADGKQTETAPATVPHREAAAPEVQTGQPDNDSAVSQVAGRTETSARRRSRHPVKTELRPTTANDEELAELFALTPLAATEPAEFEQVVSIEIPRSTLMLWGVPVNADRAGENVKAEVVIGEDGVARAIRLRN